MPSLFVQNRHKLLLMTSNALNTLRAINSILFMPYLFFSKMTDGVEYEYAKVDETLMN